MSLPSPDSLLTLSLRFRYQASEGTAQMDARLILRDPFAQHFLCTQLLGVLLAEESPPLLCHVPCPLTTAPTPNYSTHAAPSFAHLASDAVAVVVANHKLPVNDELCKGLVEVRRLRHETFPCTPINAQPFCCSLA